MGSQVLEIVLEPVAAGGGPAFRSELRAGATCTIGTGRNADIRLPRPPYMTVGQAACRLVSGDGTLVLESLGGLVHAVTLDDVRLTSGPIEPGEHALDLSGHRFRLTIRPLG